VARRRHTRQRSITGSWGLERGNRYHARCGTWASTSLITAPWCQGAWSITSTTVGYCSAGEAHAPSRTWRATPACKRRGPALVCFPVGWALPRSTRHVVRCPVTKWRAPQIETRSWPSRWPTRGRGLVSPRGVRRVGSSEQRASSWLRRTSAPASALFFSRADPAGPCAAGSGRL
jgi:hypothetical protein